MQSKSTASFPLQPFQHSMMLISLVKLFGFCLNWNPMTTHGCCQIWSLWAKWWVSVWLCLSYLYQYVLFMSRIWHLPEHVCVCPSCCCPLTTSELWCLSGGKRADYQNCSVLYCILKLCTVISTLRWAVLTVLWIGFCHTGPISLFIDWFVFVFCVFLFYTA